MSAQTDAIAGTLPTRDTVWSSSIVYDARNRKVATSLAAIAKLLDTRRPLGGRESEFLDVYNSLRALSPRTYTLLAKAPETYCWAHEAYESLRSYFRASRCAYAAPVSRIPELLEDFKPLALGAHLVDHGGLRLESPYSCDLPLHLPCTDLVLYGHGRAQLWGVSNDCIEVSIDNRTFKLSASAPEGTSDKPVSLARAPTIALDGGRIVLSPYVFKWSRVDSSDRDRSLELGLDGHWQYRARVENALAVMKRLSPDVHRQVAALISCIGLNDPARAERSQSSLSDMPGTFFISCYENPYVTCDCLIHEYYHNRLFALEEFDRLFQDEEQEKGLGDVHLFSPWRVSIRPIKGLFHSAYVFIPVARFWLSAYQSLDPDDPVRRQALDDCVRQVLNLRIGMHLLGKHGVFTAYGQAIFDAMKESVDEIIEASRTAGIPRDTTAMWHNLDGTFTPVEWTGYEQPVSVRENLQANIRHYDVNNDCRDLPFEI